MKEDFNLKLMTYNIGGGRKNLRSYLDEIVEIIKQESPDILGVQEAAEWSTMDGDNISQPKRIIEDGLTDYHYFFGPTLAMRENFHPRKALFVYGIFNDWQNWQQGNALFSRWPFVRLGDSNKPGRPENIPLYRTLYAGNRDTDPRFAVLARIDLGFAKIFVLTTHLTTLYGERGTQNIPRKKKEAQALRWEQCERILDLTQAFILEKNEILIILGDLNAIPNEPGILSLLENKGGLVRLIPNNNVGTHLKVAEPVDHILIYPGNYHIKYSCKVIDNGFVASDHNPVVAKISLHNSNSKAFQDHGTGVFREDLQ